jgi:lysophosphatidate acyltransferase
VYTHTHTSLLSLVDWVLAELLCVKQGGFGGRTRYILKDTIKYLPLYGWILGERGGIFVKRRRGQDQENFIKGLRRLADTNTPTWLVIFPEGTRFNANNPDRIEKSQEYARSLGVTEMRHVLTPKTTGFELSLGNIRDHFAAVYDVTIYYEGYHHGNQNHRQRSPPPDLFNFFSGACCRIHIHLHRTPVTDLPHGADEQRMWLYNAYCQKDRLIEEALTTGSYSFSPSVPCPLPLQRTLLPTLIFSGIIIGAISHRYGQLWWVGSVVGFSAVGVVRMALKS